MNVIRTSRNIAIIALLLSLLFHSSSILYIFSQKTRNSYHPLLEQNKENHHTTQQEKQKKSTEWVETHARANNFGAPVFFEDLPDEDPDDKVSEPLNETITNQSEAIKNEPVLVEPEKNTSEHIPQQEETAVQEEKKHTPQCIIKQSMQPSAQKVNPVQQKKASPRKTPQKKQTVPKPPLTLAQLTEGFLHQPKKHAGSYGISMLGIKQGLPSDEQMKYERYIQKLSWCLQNSYNIHAHRMPAFSSDTIMYLLFTLSRDGTLQQLVVRKSSGNIFLDNFVVFVFREASVSFPPVPRYLPDDPFQMTCVIPLKIMRY